METITVTLDLPVYAPLSSTVRALEMARDAQLIRRLSKRLQWRQLSQAGDWSKPWRNR